MVNKGKHRRSGLGRLKDNQYLIRAIFWTGMAVPTLVLWRDSVALVLVISLATQIDTSLGAHEARKARKEGQA